MYHNIYDMWHKTTLLLLMWPRDAKRLNTPAKETKIPVFGLRAPEVETGI